MRMTKTNWFLSDKALADFGIVPSDRIQIAFSPTEGIFVRFTNAADTHNTISLGVKPEIGMERRFHFR